MATILVTVIVSVFSVIYVGRQLRATADKDAEVAARRTAAIITASVQGIFENAFEVVSETHDSLIALKEEKIADPTVYDVVLRRVIDSGTDRYGAWYVWTQHDAPLHSSEEQPAGVGYATYWHQNGIEILRDRLPDEILEGPLYRVPLTTGRSFLLEPHKIDAVASDTTLVTSFSKPITYGNKVIGAIAIDLKLDAISDALAGINLPRGAFFTVVSSGGLVAMSTQHGWAGSALGQVAPALAMRLVGAQKSDGSELTYDRKAGGATLQSHTAIHFDGVDTPWYLLLDVPEQSLFAGATRDNLSLLMVPAIGLSLILVVILLVVWRMISQPIRALARIINGLGDGLFNIAVPNTRREDEVGDIARAVERLQASGLEIGRLQEAQGNAAYQREVDRRKELDTISSRFSHSIETLVTALYRVATNVAAQSQEMSMTSQDALSTIAGVSESSTAARSNMAEVAAGTNALLASIGSISDQMRLSRLVWERMQARTASTDRSVADFRNTVVQIDAIASDIQAIAGQINMIALNATIEAARAGGTGRGFAIVASEIKELAAQTAKATEDIGRHIKHVHRASHDADAQIADMKTAFAELWITAETIAADLDLQSGATADIRRLVDQATSGAGSVERNVSGLMFQANAVHSKAENMRREGDLLGQETRRLNGEVVQFLKFLEAS